MKIRLEQGSFGWDYYLKAENGDTILIQTDREYPAAASCFGWVPCRRCNMTDGTVDCEHKTATEMIQEAQDFLNHCIGEEYEDSCFETQKPD